MRVAATVLLADPGWRPVWLPLLLVALLLVVALRAAAPPDEAVRWRWAWRRGQRTSVEADDQAALVAVPGRRVAGLGLLVIVGLLVLVAALLVALLT